MVNAVLMYFVSLERGHGQCCTVVLCVTGERSWSMLYCCTWSHTREVMVNAVLMFLESHERGHGQCCTDVLGVTRERSWSMSCDGFTVTVERPWLTYLLSL